MNPIRFEQWELFLLFITIFIIQNSSRKVKKSRSCISQWTINGPENNIPKNR